MKQCRPLFGGVREISKAGQHLYEILNRTDVGHVELDTGPLELFIRDSCVEFRAIGDSRRGP